VIAAVGVDHLALLDASLALAQILGGLALGAA